MNMCQSDAMKFDLLPNNPQGANHLAIDNVVASRLFASGRARARPNMPPDISIVSHKSAILMAQLRRGTIDISPYKNPQIRGKGREKGDGGKRRGKRTRDPMR
jgi:hypothetical protein